MNTESMFEKRLSQGLVRPERMVPLGDGQYRLHVPNVWIGDAGVRIATGPATDVFVPYTAFEDACIELALRDNVSMELEQPSFTPLTPDSLKRFTTIDLDRVVGMVSRIVIPQGPDSERLFVDVLPMETVPLSRIWNSEPPIPFKVGMRGLLKDGKFSIITFDIIPDDDSGQHQILNLTK